MAALLAAAAAGAAFEEGPARAPVDLANPTGLLAPAVDVDAAGARRAVDADDGAARVVAEGRAELDDIDEGVAPRLRDMNRRPSTSQSRSP